MLPSDCFDHPSERDDKAPEELVEFLGAELAAFGAVLIEMGTRFRDRPERITTNEVVNLMTTCPKAQGVLNAYRRALVTTWRLEDPPTRKEFES